MRRRQLSDRWLLILLLLLLGGIAIVERVTAFNEADPPLSTLSDERDGASALKSWLVDLGFDIADETLDEFRIPADTQLVFLLEPSEPILPNEWEMLEDWVDDGGILVVSGGRASTLNAYFNLGYGIFDLETISVLENDLEAVEVQREAPFLTAAEIDGSLELGDNLTSIDENADVDQVIHLSVGGYPLVLSQQIGNGQIIIAPDRELFSNEGLFGEANRDIILNLVALAGDGRIWFDEWHHGERELAFFTGEVTGPLDWLRFTPSGRAILLVLALIFIFMLLNGRYFGRPQPLPESLERRGAAEYVDAIAELTRQTGDTQIIATHSYTRLRRAIIKRFRLDPRLTDREIVNTLEKIKPGDAASEASKLLHGLKQNQSSEQELIRLHTEIDRFTEEYL